MGNVIDKNKTGEAQPSTHQENQEFESNMPFPLKQTDISKGKNNSRTCAQADAVALKHGLIKQHMLLFLLPGAAGGVPLLT